jgi:TolB-like protein/DNA-binding winged helix-turn-helix (wHTH) protein/thioredoxin-like negative regulator of GroEL
MNAPQHDRTNQALARGFRLEELEVDPAAGEVSGPGGREKLDPKVMKALVLMAQHAGRVVPRDELFAQLWPNAHVSDDALTRCFYELRKALGRAGGDEHYRAMIETLPKRGYRLNGKVKPTEPSSDARPPGAPKRRIAGLAIVAAGSLLLVFAGLRLLDSLDSSSIPGAETTVNSIAVLPFVDMSEDHDQAHLADGISEEILNRLARAGDLKVISRTSSFAFRDRPVDIPGIATSLGVSHVLEGSVRRSGDDIRITAQLIAASNNAHVWSATFDRKKGDLFAVQDEIAEAIATALRVKLNMHQATDESRVNPEAYELFLQGQFFYNRRAPGDIERSVRYYRDAVAIDPGFARAWAALAGAYSLLKAQQRESAESWLQLQGEAAQKAVDLAPGLAVAHARLGLYYSSVANRRKGSEHLQMAMALDADDPLVMGFASDRAVWRGDIDTAVEIWRRLVQRNPLSPIDSGNLAYFLSAAGHLDESIVQWHRTMALNPDGHWSNRFELARLLILRRRHEEAVNEVMRLPIGEPRDFGMALLHRLPGYEAQADAALQRLAALPVNVENIQLAELYASRGMNEEAIVSLLAVRDALSSSVESPYWSLAQDYNLRTEMLRSPHLKPLRSDPRWAELMSEPARR